MQRLYVVSAHPLAGSILVRILAADSVLRSHLYPKPYASPSLIPQEGEALLVIDTSALSQNIASACRLLKARNSTICCLFLLHPDRSGEDEMLRLLYAGADGCLRLTEALENELPQAVRALLDGELWIPPAVLRKYVQQSNLLVEHQFSRDQPLTPRESQVFQLVGRRLSNKEIANALKISERTAKFHVSNILAKLGIHGREAVFQEAPRPSVANAVVTTQ